LAGAAQGWVIPAPGPVELTIVDRDTGQVLRTWRHDGRLFVAGEPGDRYSLRVSNHTNGRVLVVMSVDGVNILTGETANYGQRGYVFLAHQSYDVTGWRKSDSQVAAFTFAPLPQSYAARTGRPADVGVIGMAVFREKVEPPPEPVAQSQPWHDPAERSRGDASAGIDLRRGAPAPPQPPPAPAAPSAETFAARPAPSAAPAQRAGAAPSARYSANADAADAAERDDRLGTAHGAREWSQVSVTSFERATAYPQFVRQVEYDTYAHLVAAGVIASPPDAEPHPRPFPADPGYVPDPPGED
jgi:hypothetical protein